MADMSALELGTYVFVHYDGDVPWHVRLVIGWIENSEYVCVSPDFDIFIEQVDSANADLDGLRIGDHSGDCPIGLRGGGAQIYGFRNRHTASEVSTLLIEGASFSATERQSRGLVGAGGVIDGGDGMNGAPCDENETVSLKVNRPPVFTRALFTIKLYPPFP